MTVMIRRQIEAELKDIRKETNEAEHHCFPIWLVSLFHFRREFSSEIIAEIFDLTRSLEVEGGSGDAKLDGFYFDQSECTLYLYQAKWPEKYTKRVPPNEAAQIAQALNKLESDRESKAYVTETRQEVINALEEVVEGNGQIVLRAACGGVWGAKTDKAIQDELPKELNYQVTVETFDLDALEEYMLSVESDLSGELVYIDLFHDSKDRTMELPGNSRLKDQGYGDASVCLMSGLSIGQITKDWEQRLFDRNVRSYLGRKGRNEAMIRTLQDKEGRESFWHGHNGITILCDDYEYLLDKDNEPIKVSVTNPQIVNGCQTATTLRDAIPDIASSDVAITARILKLENTNAKSRADISDDIAYRTNNQSAVKDADLMSNDPIQRTYQKTLHDFGSYWFYERKRGEWNNLTARTKRRFLTTNKQPRRFTKETYSQAWRAYSGHPSLSVTRKNEVWVQANSSQVTIYNEVFHPTRRPEDIVLVIALLDWFSQVFAVRQGTSMCLDLNKSLKPFLDRINRAKMLMATHSVAMYGFLVREAFVDLDKYDKESIVRIVDGLDRGTRVKKYWGKTKGGPIKRAVKPIMKAWFHYLKSNDKSRESTYVTLKRPEAFDDLVENLKNEIEDEDPKTLVLPIGHSLIR
jgi:hypothetical protein